jgi:diguanylate cyclase (GGDEF)-like protein
MFLDFDRFKLINDSLGHDVGDAFLREVADRLRAVVPDGNLVARLGGDEFAVLLQRAETIASLEPLAQQMQAVIRQPLLIQGHELHTSASIGIRISDDTTQSAQHLLRDADTAMYRAKAAGKARHCLFDAQMHAEAMEHLELEGELRQAIQHRLLTVALQPIVEIATGEVVAFEAFARWPHPRLGTLAAGRFVPLAEECGLGRALSLLTLEEACRGIRQLCDATRRELRVQVNVGALELSQPGFDSRVASALVRSSLPARQLLVEVTEAQLGRHRDAMMQNLQGLAELGVGLCLDDFGTGYAALNQLQTLPFAQLKVDGRLLSEAGGGPGPKVLNALVQLGNNLGLTVVAEGVESAAQLEYVRRVGCQRAQGYLFGLPRPAVLWADALVADGDGVRLVREAGDDSLTDALMTTSPARLAPVRPAETVV